MLSCGGGEGSTSKPTPIRKVTAQGWPASYFRGAASGHTFRPSSWLLHVSVIGAMTDQSSVGGTNEIILSVEHVLINSFARILGMDLWLAVLRAS